MLNQESNSRKQFEGDLKRVFLKNLTQMNMEAYSLFNGGEGEGEGAASGAGGQTEGAGEVNRYANTNAPAAPGVIRGMAEEEGGRGRAPSVQVANHASTVQSARQYTPAPGSYVYPQTDQMMQRPTNVAIASRPLHSKPVPTVHFANNVSTSSSSRSSRSSASASNRGANGAVSKKHIANSRLQEGLGIDMRHNVDLRASIENQIPRAYPGVQPTPL